MCTFLAMTTIFSLSPKYKNQKKDTVAFTEQTQHRSLQRTAPKTLSICSREPLLQRVIGISCMGKISISTNH